MNKEFNEEALLDLCEAFLTLQDLDEYKKLLIDLLSENELKKVVKRWLIAKELNKGYSQRTVADIFKTGSFTATRANKMLRHGEIVKDLLIRMEQQQELHDAVQRGEKEDSRSGKERRLRGRRISPMEEAGLDKTAVKKEVEPEVKA